MKMLTKLSYVCLGLAVMAGCSKDAPAPVISSSNPTGTNAAAGIENGSSGKGGSSAMFTISGNFLYVVNSSGDYSNLTSYDLTNPENPAFRSSLEMESGAETIFSTADHLFIGSQTGLRIFDITSKENPMWVSEYRHATSCDPVVVDGRYAYVTLRGGTDCRQSVINSMEVIDLQNLNNPELLLSQNMKSPYGLGVDGNTVFVCEGENGLKVFEYDKQNPSLEMLPVSQIDNLTCYDLIAGDKHLIVTGENGVYQYDYSNTKSLSLLSTIPVIH